MHSHRGASLSKRQEREKIKTIEKMMYPEPSQPLIATDLLDFPHCLFVS